MARESSPERKSSYYLGTALIVLGFLLFASTFVTFARRFGDFTDFEEDARSEALRALAGMALMVVGSVLRGIGAKGLAGSGVVLDPERAREDLEPYSRMVGGMAKDALEEADVNLGTRVERVVMIRCPSCAKLNEVDTKFCQECGIRF